MHNTSLFERIGGKDAVKAAVDLFYKKNILDPRVRHYFLEIDLASLKSHQMTFLTYVFGGLPHYSGKSLHEAHKDLVNNMGLNDSHFDAVAENLQDTLTELGVDTTLIDEVMELVGSARELLLRGTGA